MQHARLPAQLRHSRLDRLDYLHQVVRCWLAAPARAARPSRASAARPARTTRRPARATTARAPDPLHRPRFQRLDHVHQVVRHRLAVALALDQEPRPPRRLRVPVPGGDAQLQQARMPSGLRGAKFTSAMWSTCTKSWRWRLPDALAQVTSAAVFGGVAYARTTPRLARATHTLARRIARHLVSGRLGRRAAARATLARRAARARSTVEANGGKPCASNDVAQSRSCNSFSCPVDCILIGAGGMPWAAAHGLRRRLDAASPQYQAQRAIRRQSMKAKRRSRSATCTSARCTARSLASAPGPRARSRAATAQRRTRQKPRFGGKVCPHSPRRRLQPRPVPHPLHRPRLQRLDHVHQVVRHRHAVALALDQAPTPATVATCARTLRRRAAAISTRARSTL